MYKIDSFTLIASAVILTLIIYTIVNQYLMRHKLTRKPKEPALDPPSPSKEFNSTQLIKQIRNLLIVFIILQVVIEIRHQIEMDYLHSHMSAMEDYLSDKMDKIEDAIYSSSK